MASGFSTLSAGMAVRGADTHRVGEVKEVHQDDIVIHRWLQPPVHVPLEAISGVTATEVILVLTAGEVDELYWVHAGEDIEIDLHGIYKYDYVTP